MAVKKKAAKKAAPKKTPVKKAKKVVKSRTPLTRAGGTMTNSVFWGIIRSALRSKSRWWPPVAQCKLKARRPYKGPNKRQKYEYQCKSCKEWFIEKKINVDHIVPAGRLLCEEDLPGFVNRLFCEVEHLQVLCKKCHNEKTKLEAKTETK